MKRTKPAPAERHLSWEFLARRIKRGTPSIELIEGAPRCELTVEATGGRLALRINAPAATDERLPNFAAVECLRVGSGSRSYVQLSCTDHERFQEFYAFLTSVADRVQLQEQPVHEAIADAAEAVRELLAGGDALSLERQLGLWGELWVLKEVASRTDWKSATEAWVANGDSPEEHDFALTKVDIEVKTTNSELRRHHVSSASQFLPKHGRELFVVSLQVTTGGAGGTTLADSVEQARSSSPRSMSARLEKVLKAQGWRDSDADRYSTRWVHRNAPMVIEASEIPRLIVTGANPTRLVLYSYVVDVAGLGDQASGEWKWMK